MNAWRTAVGTAFALATLTATTVLAQGKDKSKPPADSCKIDFGHNDQVREARNSITLLQLNATHPEDAKKKLREAVSTLTSRPDFGKDQMARDFVLGEALVIWADQPGQPLVAPRGDIGYQSDKTGTVDLLAAADTAFRAVETAMPECAGQTDVFRQQPWARLINQVGPMLNRNQVDSATEMLQRSLEIYRGSPYSYYYEGQIAQRKNDWTGAADAYTKAAQLVTPDDAAQDSTMKNIREFSEFSAAYSALKAGQGMSGDQQKAEMKKAADLYRTYLKDFPDGPNTQPARAGLTVALQAMGDTASLASLWQDMVANPSHYSDTQLFDAGAQAFGANQYQTAVQLMEAGRKMNPYLRPGLFNLANAYWKTNQYDKMVGVVDTLLQIDPNNPDNDQLLAIAYQGLGKAATDPKVKKADNDSVTKYVAASEKIPVRISFSQFTHEGSKVTLAGTVENLGSTPKTTSLKVDFLDKTGATVTTQTVPVTLGPKGTKQFTLDADGASIAAYKYDEIK